MLYLVYLVECWHSHTRIELQYKVESYFFKPVYHHRLIKLVIISYLYIRLHMHDMYVKVYPVKLSFHQVDMNTVYDKIESMKENSAHRVVEGHLLPLRQKNKTGSPAPIC